MLMMIIQTLQMPFRWFGKKKCNWAGDGVKYAIEKRRDVSERVLRSKLKAAQPRAMEQHQRTDGEEDIRHDNLCETSLKTSNYVLEGC